MKTSIKQIILSTVFLTIASGASAQALSSGYFVDEYKYRHAINPAVGNEQNYIAIPALGSVNVRMIGNFGIEDVLQDNPLYPDQSDKKKTTFMNPYIADPLDKFSNGINKVGAQAEIALLSVGFKAFGGYNTFELNSKSNAYLKLPYELLEFATSTSNQNYNIGDIFANAQSYMELAVGHSHQLNDKWRVGAKVKLLLGIADFDLSMKDIKANLTGDTWTIQADAQAHTSMKGFKYVSKTNRYKGTNETYERVKDIDIDGAGIGGLGAAVDLGMEYKMNDAWKLSAALLDLGFISWKNDMYATNTSKSFTFDGFHDTSIRNDHGNTMDDQADDYDDQISDFIHLKDQGDQGSRTTGIGARLNLAAEYTIPSYKQLKVGLLSSTRFWGEHTWTEERLSGNWEPLNWLGTSVNVGLNSYTATAGWMINIHPKYFNFFVGMDGILCKMSKGGIPLNSNGSISFGFNIAL